MNEIHFIGIGGSSMNGLALIMQDKGYKITGSDMNKTAFTDHLEEKGIEIAYGQRAENIKSPDLVIYTAAISDNNPELVEAKKRGITTMERADFLGEITREYTNVVGIAGCHGKTTITSMLAKIMMEREPSPTIHVGGNVPFLKGGTHIGTRDLFITEACEYVNSYHKFQLNMAVINNIDDDHLDFFKNIENIYQSFLQFARQLPDDGTLIANMDDPLVAKITKYVNCKVLGYGLDADTDYQAKKVVQHGDSSITFDIYKSGQFLSSCKLRVPGRHNVQNALAAIVVALEQGVALDDVISSLAEYRLTDRRFEYYGKKNGANIFHDYAHHPTEIEACIKTAQELPHERIVAVFQCHTYSRAVNLMDKYAKVLSRLDEVLVPDIYAAREPDLGKVHAKDIVRAINDAGGKAEYYQSFEEMDEHLKGTLQKGDILLALGAGDIGSKCRIFVEKN